ncbi:MAG: TetR family transcriptional regulator [Pseudomonadota bacterium]
MPSPPRKRPSQQRSRERVDLILRAAGELLVESGLESLSTNAIAARAGIPIGSLYQFFGDKDEIISELVQRASDDIDAFATRDLQSDDLRANPASFVKTLVTGIGRIQKQYAGFVCLFAPSGTRDSLSVADRLKQVIVDRLEAVFAEALPQLPQDERGRIINVWIDITRGMIGSLDASPESRVTLAAELPVVLHAYLQAKLAAHGRAVTSPPR